MGRSGAKRRRDADRAWPRDGGAEAPLLSAEERALREARWRAERKVKLAGDAVRLALIAIPLLVFLPPIGVVVLLIWGSGVARRAWELLGEPRVRERFLAAEVQNRVSATLSEERSELEGRHARSLEELAAGVAHEIRTPITAAKSLVQQMEEDPRAAENVEYARVALAELERVERSVSHLLRFAREEETEIGPLRLCDVVDSALASFGERAARSKIELVREIDCAGELRGDPEKLRRVVINLVGNAIESLEAAKTPGARVEVAMGEDLAGSHLWLRVRDNGPGIGAEVRERLFGPFASAKPGGTGLGLAITRKLVEAHGGAIEASSPPGRGAEFLVVLPRVRSARGSGA
jgi:signal transduction histidine kinase